MAGAWLADYEKSDILCHMLTSEEELRAGHKKEPGGLFLESAAIIDWVEHSSAFRAFRE